MPNPKEHREEVRKKYIDFLTTLGIEVEVPKGKESNIPKPIPKDQYPNSEVPINAVVIAKGFTFLKFIILVFIS